PGGSDRRGTERRHALRVLPGVPFAVAAQQPEPWLPPAARFQRLPKTQTRYFQGVIRPPERLVLREPGAGHREALHRPVRTFEYPRLSAPFKGQVGSSAFSRRACGDRVPIQLGRRPDDARVGFQDSPVSRTPSAFTSELLGGGESGGSRGARGAATRVGQ